MPTRAATSPKIAHLNPLPEEDDDTADAEAVTIPPMGEGWAAQAGKAHASDVTVMTVTRLRRRISATWPSWLVVNGTAYTLARLRVATSMQSASRCLSGVSVRDAGAKARSPHGMGASEVPVLFRGAYLFLGLRQAPPRHQPASQPS